MAGGTGIRPGDLLATHGGGLVGAIIRHGTGSAQAHTGVFVRLLGATETSETWLTVEAWPNRDRAESGTRLRTREVPVYAEPGREFDLLVLRVARTEEEAAAIVRCALRTVGTPYGWQEIARIGMHMLGIRWRVADDPGTAICSNVSRQAVIAGRPDLAGRFQYPEWMTWPGRLVEVLLVAPDVRVVTRQSRPALAGALGEYVRAV